MIRRGPDVEVCLVAMRTHVIDGAKEDRQTDRWFEPLAVVLASLRQIPPLCKVFFFTPSFKIRLREGLTVEERREEVGRRIMPRLANSTVRPSQREAPKQIRNKNRGAVWLREIVPSVESTP